MYTVFIYMLHDCYGTVLVAHNGFVFDFPLLLAEIERRPNCLSTQHFVSHNIHFGDTLPHLRQVYTCTVTAVHE